MQPGDTVKLRGEPLGKTWVIKKMKSTKTGFWIVFQNALTVGDDEIWHNTKHYEVV